MKKSFYLLVAATVCATTTVLAQSGDGVEINGVKWATHNVGGRGAFVANPQDFGNYYKFDEAQEACPKGWRTPTAEKIETLIQVDSEW